MRLVSHSGWTNKIYMHTYCKSSILIKTKTVRIFILWFIQIAFICCLTCEARARLFHTLFPSLTYRSMLADGQKVEKRKNEFSAKAQTSLHKVRMYAKHKGHNSLKQSMETQREIMRNCNIKRFFYDLTESNKTVKRWWWRQRRRRRS